MKLLIPSILIPLLCLISFAKSLTIGEHCMYADQKGSFQLCNGRCRWKCYPNEYKSGDCSGGECSCCKPRPPCSSYSCPGGKCKKYCDSNKEDDIGQCSAMSSCRCCKRKIVEPSCDGSCGYLNRGRCRRSSCSGYGKQIIGQCPGNGCVCCQKADCNEPCGFGGTCKTSCKGYGYKVPGSCEGGCSCCKNYDDEKYPIEKKAPNKIE